MITKICVYLYTLVIIYDNQSKSFMFNEIRIEIGNKDKIVRVKVIFNQIN